ncbi:OmpL47-type beta-barrel domain-containing protein [Humibacillus xanthopallidus]|uniref:OmpL47-type beta-barrel domain-containing protein n=1 Tax=Humibacillus xanthopallidus TaxID=412689 RepID=UPI00384A6F20
MNVQTSADKGEQSRRRRGAGRVARRLLAGAAVASVVGGGINVAPAAAASISSAQFTGGAGTVAFGGVLYAKVNAALTLTVQTSNDIQCVILAGTPVPRQTSSPGKTVWTFSLNAPTGNGVQNFAINASEKYNDNNCTGQSATTQASYTVDNAGPVVTAALTPAANAAGWNNTNVTVKWTAADAGSGVAVDQPFQTDIVTSNGATNLSAPAQVDRLGNSGAAGAVTVRVDKAAPTITATQTKNANGTTTVTFNCSDSVSGGGEASGIVTCLADGTVTNSKTVEPGITVTGTATDKAGNTATTSSTAPAGDTTAPLLSGTPASQPNGAGWYKDDVTVDWTASDSESGIPTAPSDTTITGEGTGLTSSKTVTNGAGLSTTATSTPAVNIDRTAPTTSISGTSNSWVNGNVTVTLSASDNLSGVAKTEYSVDGEAMQTGTSLTLGSEGDHAVTFFSTDKVGNVEAVQTAHVRIDKTAPSISHAFAPLTYTDGAWTNQDVTVTFTCADQGGSDVASCTAPVTMTAEGSHNVSGVAADGAGSTASDTADVRIDKTAPSISATASGTKNAAGWYRENVTVTYTTSDDLSGVSGSPNPEVLGEGLNQSASAFVTDAAGNSASAGVSSINIDKTEPLLSADFTSGWHTGDVTVTWTCTDALSHVATGPADDIVSGEGDNLSSTASCTDVAGNTATETVTGIKIDRSAPVTTGALEGAQQNGWYGSDVKVTLSAHDNFTDVAETIYTLDGGAEQSYSGAFSVSADGPHTVEFWSQDGAGNTETAGAPLTFQIDKTAPTTNVVIPSTDTGWYVTSGIPVAFQATDALSGIGATYYTIDDGTTQIYGQPFTADLSTGVHTITYWSVDIAGNDEAKDSVRTTEIKVDTIAPTIKGSQSPAANAAGWNNTDVDVKFTCSDADSGIDGVAGCAGDTTLSNDGAGLIVHGDAVDVAGNRSEADFGPVNIDKTKPTLVGVPSDPNAAGWHKGDVAVTWVGDDALSKIDSSSQPASSTITGEGRHLGTGPKTIRDNAGNVSEEASVTGIKIDRTAPGVNGAPKTSANAADWYQGEVVVDFSCSDPQLADGTDGSGVASCPTSKLLKGDGANQSVTSDAATDMAGNVGVGKTVGGINIDGTAPTTTSNNLCTKTAGWCTGATAPVVLSAADQTGLSGVKEIHYVVNDGAEQVAAGASTTATVPLDGSGEGTVRYWAVDKAGNSEARNTVDLKWDNIAPTVSHALSPAPNADEWNNTDVTVTFSAKDDDKGSGLAAGTLTAPATLSAETAGQLVTGSAKDTAGNTGTDSVTVKLDKTAPTITGAITIGTLGNNGWYVGPVTVTFTCGDALSGVATCPDPVTLTANGLNAANGTVTDKAGNTAAATMGGIKIDQEKPTLTSAGVNVQGGTFTVGSVPAATCTATDSFSGVATCKVVVTGGNANGVGTFTYAATATDSAGNVTTITGTYKAVYRFDGYLQPINDTAHQVGTSTSIFKAGSTIPVKLQLRKADGTVVQAATAPVWFTPVKGSAMSAPVDESLYSVSADSGSTYRYDATAQQYIYNWKTDSKGGNYWRIGVALDDGQTYYVNIGLR